MGIHLYPIGDDALMFEVTLGHDLVWEHDFGNNNVFVARGQKYPMNYLGGEFPDYTLGDVDFDGVIGVQDLLYIADIVSNNSLIHSQLQTLTRMVVRSLFLILYY